MGAGHMNKSLCDSDPKVRKNTLMVLTHLILNDMQKAKGPTSHIAKRLQDKDPSISKLAKTFFHELSRKGKNPVYNILPDVISRLSHDKDVNDNDFKKILSFLINFITKDKHIESLIEKLCHRFQNTHLDGDQFSAEDFSMMCPENTSDYCDDENEGEDEKKRNEDEMYDDEKNEPNSESER